MSKTGWAHNSKTCTAVPPSLFNIVTPGVPVDFTPPHVSMLLSSNGAFIETWSVPDPVISMEGVVAAAPGFALRQIGWCVFVHKFSLPLCL